MQGAVWYGLPSSSNDGGSGGGSRGVLECDDGTVYEGDVDTVSMTMTGLGVLRSPTAAQAGGAAMAAGAAAGAGPGAVVYEGEFIGDLRQGRGRQTFADGSWYEGGWVGDRMEGWGRMQYANGSWYEGNWRGGRRHSQVCMY